MSEGLFSVGKQSSGTDEASRRLNDGKTIAKPDPEDEVTSFQPQDGKIYRYNGTEFEELEPSGEQKLPVRPDAVETVKRMRKQMQQVTGMRPELVAVVSAMLVYAATHPGVEEFIEDYGEAMYAQAKARRRKAKELAQAQQP